MGVSYTPYRSRPWFVLYQSQLPKTSSSFELPHLHKIVFCGLLLLPLWHLQVAGDYLPPLVGGHPSDLGERLLVVVYLEHTLEVLLFSPLLPGD